MEPSIEEIPFNFHQMNSSILVDTLHISNDSDQIFLNNLRMEKTESFSANANMSLSRNDLMEIKPGGNLSVEGSEYNSKMEFFDSDETNDGIEKLLEDFQKDFGTDEATSDKVFMGLISVYGIAILFGIMGNMVILYAILSNKKMRTPRNFFIVNLAISDLLLCSMTMPLTLWEVLSRKWPFGENLEWLCQLAHSCQGTPVFLSSMAIVAIAVDRYRCIMQPNHLNFNSKAAICISLVMTTLSVLLTIPMFVTAEIKHFIEFPDTVNMADILICQDIWKGSSKIAYTVTSSCAQYLLPVILVITSYLSIYMKLRNRPLSQRAENNEKRRRTNVMILCIAMIFFISWLPLNLFNIFMELHPGLIRPFISGNEAVVYAVLHLFGLCNAITNPILYGYLNENFRKEYKGIYRKIPWYSSSHADNTLEVGAHCRIRNPHTINNRRLFDTLQFLKAFKLKSQNTSGTTFIKINNGTNNGTNNVKEIGHLRVAQRLVFAASAVVNSGPVVQDFSELGGNLDESSKTGNSVFITTNGKNDDSGKMEQNEIEKVEQNKIGMSKNQDHCCLLEKKPNMVIDGCENKIGERTRFNVPKMDNMESSWISNGQTSNQVCFQKCQPSDVAILSVNPIKEQSIFVRFQSNKSFFNGKQDSPSNAIFEQRPFLKPFCHTVDFEGLRETAV